jgi:hypothetical protein
MASATLFLTENVDSQAKYDETKRRMKIIRQAIVGDPTRRLNGQTEISGFAADMGRLPGCLRELVEPKHCIDASGALAAWTIDANTGLGSGWRGPYIKVTPESDGALRFRDGFFNTATDNADLSGSNQDASDTGDDEKNHGWTWALYDDSDTETTDSSLAESIRLQSYGVSSDGTEKYPTGALATIEPLVFASDFQSQLINWDSFVMSFDNKSSPSSIITIPADSLRIKLSYPIDGSINEWPDNAADRDNSDYLSDTFPSSTLYISNGVYAVSTSDTVTVPLGSVLNNNELLIGSMGTLSFSSSSDLISVKANDILIVPEGSSLSVSTLNFTNNGSIFFPPYEIDIGLQFPEEITPVNGQYSVIVACDDTLNETAVSGKRFDGDCSRYGTDLLPVDYIPLNTSLFLNIPARVQGIAPPSISWVIQ